MDGCWPPPASALPGPRGLWSAAGVHKGPALKPIHKLLREAASRARTFQCHCLAPSGEHSLPLSLYHCCHQIFTGAAGARARREPHRLFPGHRRGGTPGTQAGVATEQDTCSHGDSVTYSYPPPWVTSHPWSVAYLSADTQGSASDWPPGRKSTTRVGVCSHAAPPSRAQGQQGPRAGEDQEGRQPASMCLCPWECLARPVWSRPTRGSPSILSGQEREVEPGT